jgi:hypothetical protein
LDFNYSITSLKKKKELINVIDNDASPASRNDFLLGISGPQRPLQLHSSDWMNCMSSSDGGSRGLGETYVLYFTFFH